MLGLDGVYNTVTAAYTVTENGETLYAFVSRPYGYSNIPMAVYYVLNADGEIVMMNAKEFILEKDYFSNYTLDPQSYKEGFVGLTAETMTDDDERRQDRYARCFRRLCHSERERRTWQ